MEAVRVRDTDTPMLYADGENVRAGEEDSPRRLFDPILLPLPFHGCTTRERLLLVLVLA